MANSVYSELFFVNDTGDMISLHRRSSQFGANFFKIEILMTCITMYLDTRSWKIVKIERSKFFKLDAFELERTFLVWT